MEQAPNEGAADFCISSEGSQDLLQLFCEDSCEHLMAKCAKAITAVEPGTGAAVVSGPDSHSSVKLKSVLPETQQSDKYLLFPFYFYHRGDKLSTALI